MDKVTLQAETRGTGRHQVRELRLKEQVPAVIYGAATSPQAIAVEARELHKALIAARSGLIAIQVAEKPVFQVLAREIQRDPVRRHIIHVDFQAVSLTEKLRVSIPVEQHGIAPVLETGDFVLVRVTDTIEVECLPTDIPGHVVADISKLETVDDSVLARDLALPESVRLVTEPEHVIFAVTVSRAAIEAEEAVEEVGEAEEELEPDEVEVIAKGKAARAEEDFED